MAHDPRWRCSHYRPMTRSKVGLAAVISGKCPYMHSAWDGLRRSVVSARCSAACLQVFLARLSGAVSLPWPDDPWRPCHRVENGCRPLRFLIEVIFDAETIGGGAKGSALMLASRVSTQRSWYPQRWRGSDGRSVPRAASATAAPPASGQDCSPAAAADGCPGGIRGNT
jgi:hypothetical protein